MIVSYIEGGLGNMLFQICFTLAFAKENGCEYYFTNMAPNLIKIKREHNSNVEDYAPTIFRNVENFASSPPPYVAPFIVHYCPFEHFDVPYEPNCVNFYKGYFQSEKFFEKQKDYIKEVFKPDSNVIKQIIEIYPFLKTDKCVSMHVRRGDYLSLPYHHPTATKEYYDEALQKFSNADRILIFTDDPNWCASSFSDPRMVVMAEKDWLSLYIMSLCTGHIIANSSFSWWGAKFAEFYNSDVVKVVAPKRWFGPALAHNTNDLLSKNWVKI